MPLGQVATLSNGLRVIATEMPHARHVAIRLCVNAGSRDDPRDKAGISHFVEHLLFRGTERHPNESAFLAHARSIGAFTNATTSKEWTTLDVDVPTRNVSAALRMLAELLLTPTFNGIEVERRIVLEEVAQWYDETDGTLFRDEALGESKLWPRNAMGVPIIGEARTILDITLDDVKHYIEGHYRAGGIVVGIAGPLGLDALLPEVEATLGHLPAGMPYKSRTTPATTNGALHIIEQRYASRSSALMLFPCRGLGAGSEKPFFTTFLLAYQGAARIHEVVRSRGGIAYTSDAELVLFSDVGRTIVRGDVKKENLPQLVAVISKTLRDLKERGPSAAEMHAAREAYLLFLDRNHSEPSAAAFFSAINLLSNEPSLEEEIDLVHRVTAADIVEFAQSAFTAKTGHMVIMGPREEEDLFQSWRSFSESLGS